MKIPQLIKRVKLLRLTVLVILTALAIAACQNSATRQSSNTVSKVPSNADCRIIEHEMGETKICGQPQRILALGPYMLEPLLALGVQSIGFADHTVFHRGDFTNSSQQIPYLGSRITQSIANVGKADRPSIEALLKAQPDLIVSHGFIDKAQYQTFSKIAPTLVLNYEEIEQNLKTVAKAVNRRDLSKQIIANMERKIAMTREAFTPFVETYPKVLLLQMFNLQQMYLGNYAYGSCSPLLKELGFELVSFPELEDANPKPWSPITSVTLETLPQLNDADLVIILARKSNVIDQLDGMNSFEKNQISSIKQAWSENKIAQSLDASSSGRVYFIPYNLCTTLPGPIGTELYLEELEDKLLPTK